MSMEAELIQYFFYTDTRLKKFQSLNAGFNPTSGYANSSDG